MWIPLIAGAFLSAQIADGPVWKRHAIDDSSRGADGVKLMDVDRDGDPDIVCGWEEGGVIRLYLNPGVDRIRHPWPRVDVGKVASPEDAFPVDLDGDGNVDVISMTEGKSRSIFVHWAPVASAMQESAAWTTETFPWPKPAQSWMQGSVADLDGRNGIDLILASKGSSATVSLAMSAPEPRNLVAWSLQTIRRASWIMSVEKEDVDQDGDLDVWIVDRKGGRSGVFWLENPGAEGVRRGEDWNEHAVGALGEEPMFLSLGDLNRDGANDMAVAVRPQLVRVYLRSAGAPVQWTEEVIELSGEIGTAKGVSMADINLDGRMDLVFTCERAAGPLSGIVWLEQTPDGEWLQRPLGGPEGLKYDYPVTLDLDGDGDPDVLTCEERDQLGVVWYENPAR